jgi:polyphosphate glucokinase
MGKQWSKRLDRFLAELHRALLPDLIIVGGGASNNHEKFLPKP